MQRINLRENCIGNAGAVAIATCIFNVEALDLFGCGIEASGVETLSKEIARRQHSVNYLHIL